MTAKQQLKRSHIDDPIEDCGCHICHKTTTVRWKNIYHMGSEGLLICMPCEKKILRFLEKLKQETFSKKRAEILARKVSEQNE